MSTGNKAIPDLPPIPDPEGGSVYITKDSTDYRIDTGGIGGLATTGVDGKLTASQMPDVTSIPWSGVASKPTTIAGYGITDITFANVGAKPTTLSGYGITDAVSSTATQTITGTKTFSSTIAGSVSGSAGSVAWSGVSSKPTTLAGYGISDGITAATVSATYMPKSGGTFTNGIGFGATVGSSVTDLSNHISLHTAGYGFNVTSNSLNYTVSAGGAHHFNIGGADRAVISASGAAVTGAITATGNVTGYSSDMRLKTNRQIISHPMEKIKKLGGYEFDWNTSLCFLEGFRPDNTHEHGVLAQEVQEVMPDAVSPAPFNKKYLTVNYARLVPLLIECIKDLQDQIDELKGK